MRATLGERVKAVAVAAVTAVVTDLLILRRREPDRSAMAKSDLEQVVRGLQGK